MNFNFLACQYGEFVIKQRYILVLMTFMAIVNNYNCRMCLFIALPEIAGTKVDNSTAHECPAKEVAQEIKGGIYNWSLTIQGYIHISFYPGYLLMHLPAGYAADVYGGKHVLAAGVLVTGIVTISTPIIIQKTSWEWLCVSRFVLGIGQAGMYPAISSLLARWIPSRQRSELGSLVYSGIQVGVVTGTFITGLAISKYNNWTIIFHIWGIMCFVWYGLFLLLCYSEPDSHPYITDQEKDMLAAEFGHRKRFKTPWGAILKDLAVWTIIIAQFGHDWITYTVEMHMPQYFKSVFKFSVEDNGKVIAVPFIGMWFCSTATGYLSDYMVNKGIMKVGTARIIYTTIASVGPSTFIMISTFMGCEVVWVLTFFWIGMISMGPYYPGLKLNPIDISLNFSGVIMALANGIGVFSGILSPMIVTFFVKQQLISEWRNVFWVSFTVCSVTNIFYILFAKAERRVWDHEPELEL